MRYTILLILNLLLSTAFAQVTLKGMVEGIPDAYHQAHLHVRYGDGFMYLQSIDPDVGGNFSFIIPEPVQPGVYRVSVGSLFNGFDVFVSGTEPLITFKGKYKDKSTEQWLTFANSKEDQVYHEVMAVWEDYTARFRNGFYYHFDSIPIPEEEVFFYNDRLEQLQRKHAGTFVADSLINLFYQPSIYDKVEYYFMYPDTFELKHLHFFDYVDLNSNLALGHPAFKVNLNYYLTHYAGETLDEQKEAWQMLKSKCKGNDRMQNFIFNTFLEYYVSNYEHEMATYLVDDYLSGCYADWHIYRTPSHYNPRHTYRLLNEGRSAPPFTLSGQEGDLVRIYKEINSKELSVICFWDAASQCEKSEQYLNFLDKVAYEHRREDIGFYAVGLHSNKQAWQEEWKTEKDHYMNFYEPGGWGSKTAFDYRLTHTPTVFLVDETGQILAKNTPIEYLEQVIEKYLKSGND